MTDTSRKLSTLYFVTLTLAFSSLMSCTSKDWHTQSVLGGVIICEMKPPPNFNTEDNIGMKISRELTPVAFQNFRQKESFRVSESKCVQENIKPFEKTFRIYPDNDVTEKIYETHGIGVGYSLYFDSDDQLFLIHSSHIDFKPSPPMNMD